MAYQRLANNQVTWATGFGALLASCSFLVYHNREVSYSSLLDLSISARQRRLYDQHGLNIEMWTENVAEAKTLRREISRIAADYDIEWKGDLENLDKLGEGVVKLEDREGSGDHARKSDKSHRESAKSSSSTNSSSSSSQNTSHTATTDDKSSSKTEGVEGRDHGKDKHLDIDKTIDEASDLAEQTEHQRAKEQAAQRKGETVEDEGGGDGRGVGSRERMEREHMGRERGKEVVGKNQERFE
jgi:hypothetical protein